MEKHANSVKKIIQITDTHLFQDDHSEIFGKKSNLRFKQIINKLKTEELSDTDIIILTGDLSQDKTADSYHKITEELKNLSIPVYWISGNHDDIDVQKSVFEKYTNFHYKRKLSLPDWDLIFFKYK